ncbi:MAG: FecR domain-containing protein [Gracilimonas sp.]|uniref:FecR family protein n=1 Tax=Gracilimonas sp. TaxID=1974203 RepID=UPI0019CA9CA1|nr:FecR domain-containing protein [Gracilimonas sp.]MBD3615392.1 FecR domain-containing protein [Gracilimonas sp.]
MPNNSNISPDNADLLLAQKIGAALPNLKALDTDADPLLSELFRYKKATAEQIPAINSNSLWDSIQAEMNEQQTKAPFFTLTPAIKRYAIAAGILILAFIGSFIYQNITNPSLIAESFSNIQQVQLSDGTTVNLRPHSQLYEHSVSENSAEYRLEGEAFFEVTHNPNRTFIVKTDRAKVEVLGTKFVLSNWGGISKVFLQEGQIQYESLSSLKSVILEPGQSSVINDLNETPGILQARESVFTDWLNNELTFQNESADMIFNELEQHFDIQIESNANLESETLSGSISLKDLATVLDDLELVLDGTFTQTGDKHYVFNLN